MVIRDMWTHASLTAALGPTHALPHVFGGGNQTVFRFQDYSALNDYPGTPRHYDDGTVEAARFFSMLHRPDEHGYLYLAVPVGWLSGALLADVAPLGMLSSRPEDASVQLWVGSVGVTTQLHYDIDYNFHVQVTGTKRFTVLPPTALAAAAVFPMPHQYYRRAQLDLGACEGDADGGADAEAAALVHTPGALTVTLHPGDLLYIPPYWLHHVVNVDAGISLNVWTRAAGLKDALFGLWTSVPDVGAIGGVQRLAFYRDYLKGVLAGAGGDDGDDGDDACAMVAGHWAQRFRRLRDAGLADATLTDAPQTDTTRTDAEAGAAKGVHACATEPVLDTTLRRMLDGAVRITVAKARVAAAAAGPGYGTGLGDFIDVVAFMAVGKAHRRMGAFLADCFCG